MKSFSYFLLFQLCCLKVGAQPSIEWQKCLGGTAEDIAHAVIQTFDAGYIVVGYTESNDGDVSGNHGFEDFWVVKLDSSGGIEWKKCLGGTYDEEASDVLQTSDSGYVIVGWAASDDGDVAGLHGSFLEDFWLVKLNKAGNLVWQKCLGGTDFDFAYSFKQTLDGGFIIAGQTISNDGDVSGLHGGTGAEDDFWVVKTDSVGNFQWQKCLGGGQIDEAYSVDQSADGNYIVGGTTLSTDGDITSSYGGFDSWIVKLDSGGSILWQKSLGGSDGEGVEGIHFTQDGGSIAIHGTRSVDHDVTGSHGGQDAWLTKLSASGSLMWQKCLGGSGYDEGRSICLCTDGGYVLCGETTSNDGDAVPGDHGLGDFWVVKTDSSGNIQWQKSIGGTDEDRPYSVKQTRDGGYIVAGGTQSNDIDVSGFHGGNPCDGVGPPCMDYWVVKLSPAPVGIAAPTSAITDFTTYLTNNNLYLNFYANGNEHTQVQLLDITGRVLLQQGLTVTAGFNKQEVRAGELSAGVYMVRLVTEGPPKDGFAWAKGAVTKKVLSTGY